jgi:hypothetical protein
MTIKGNQFLQLPSLCRRSGDEHQRKLILLIRGTTRRTLVFQISRRLHSNRLESQLNFLVSGQFA